MLRLPGVFHFELLEVAFALAAFFLVEDRCPVIHIQGLCLDDRYAALRILAEDIPYGHDHAGFSVIPALEAAVQAGGVAVVVQQRDALLRKCRGVHGGIDGAEIRASVHIVNGEIHRVLCECGDCFVKQRIKGHIGGSAGVRGVLDLPGGGRRHDRVPIPRHIQAPGRDRLAIDKDLDLVKPGSQGGQLLGVEMIQPGRLGGAAVRGGVIGECGAGSCCACAEDEKGQNPCQNGLTEVTVSMIRLHFAVFLSRFPIHCLFA